MTDAPVKQIIVLIFNSKYVIYFDFLLFLLFKISRINGT